MIPYYSEPVFHAGIVAIHVFSLLLVTAVLWGGYIMVQRARHMGVRGHLMFEVSAWAMTFALIGADVAKLAMDYTPLFTANPFMIFTTSFGIRSIGGLVGGLIGALICCRLRHVSFLDAFRILDIMAFTMPFAFMIGRLGCALAHDHLGIRSTSWVAVRFPGGARYDLGLIEFLFLIPMSALFYFLGRRPRDAGLFLALYGVIYGAFRIWLDTLHIQPMRFYEGIALCCLGFAAWVVMARWRTRNPDRRSQFQPAPDHSRPRQQFGAAANFEAKQIILRCTE